MSDLNTDTTSFAVTGATINPNTQEDNTMMTDTAVQEAATTTQINPNADAVADIVSEITNIPLVASISPVAPAAPVYDLEFIKKLQAEHEAAMKQIDEYKKKELVDKENFELRERYRKEPRATSTRNTLILRRTPNHSVIAPARDVIDYLVLYDMKEEVKVEGTKIRVSDEEIKVYQNLKNDGVKVIPLDMVRAIIEAKGGSDDVEDDTEQDEVLTAA